MGMQVRLKNEFERAQKDPADSSPVINLQTQDMQLCMGKSDTPLSTAQQLSMASLCWNEAHNTLPRMFVHTLIVKIARQYAENDEQLTKLVCEGKRGFLYSLEKFDTQGSVPFSTYATQCISRYIERAVAVAINSRKSGKPGAMHMLSFDNPDHKR